MSDQPAIDANARIRELEERAMFIERDLRELDEVVRGAHDAIDALRRQVDRMERLMQEPDGTDEDLIGDEPDAPDPGAD